MEDFLATVAAEPLFTLFAGDRRPMSGLADRWVTAGFAVRTVRGRKMRTLDRLFDEFAAALQFGWYFGENLDAFDECMGDLPDWVPPGRGYVVVVDDAAQVLADDPSRLPSIVRSLGHVAGYLAEAIERGESWDRPPVPFHVVLQARQQESDDTLVRWRAAGATVEPIGAATHRIPDAYYRDLEDRLRALSERFRAGLPAAEVSYVDLYLDHGEYGLAFELLVALLGDRSTAVPPDDAVAALRDLAETMGLDATPVERLRSRNGE